jgi:hypothetical protein
MVGDDLLQVLIELTIIKDVCSERTLRFVKKIQLEDVQILML